jgi:hypothetical protein
MKIKVSVLFSISFLLIAASVQSAPVLRPDVPAGRWKVGYRMSLSSTRNATEGPFNSRSGIPRGRTQHLHVCSSGRM